MADGSIFVLNLDEKTLSENLLNYPKPCFVNLGTGIDVTIRELSETVKEVVGFKGDLVFDSTKPDGAPRKLLDVSRLQSLGWKAGTSLKEGLTKTYAWFLDHQHNLRE